MLIMADSSGNKIIKVFDDSYNKKVRQMALDLRAEDFDEVFHLYGMNPYDVVMESWDMSSDRYVILNKHDIVVGAFGVRAVDMFNGIGIPWLLGTEGLNKMKKFFVKNSKLVLNLMKYNYSYLVNYVDASYDNAVKWLKWCGFTLEEAKPFGIFRLPYHRFYMECG